MGKQTEDTSKFAVMVRSAALLPEQQWTDERIGVIKRTVAPPDAGVAEIAMFLAVAARYDLDPFAKEIWLAKDRGRLILLTGKDAILKVARRQDDYMGFEADLVYEADEFAYVRKEGDIEIVHEVSTFDRGELVGAYCLARKDGHPPVLITRLWSDYRHLHSKDNWQNYGTDMLMSRVVTAAHRLLYNISGMYTREEVDSGEADVDLVSHDVAKKSMSRLEEIKSRAREGAGGERVVDADFELEGESEPEATEGEDEDFDPFAPDDEGLPESVTGAVSSSGEIEEGDLPI